MCGVSNNCYIGTQQLRHPAQRAGTIWHLNTIGDHSLYLNSITINQFHPVYTEYRSHSWLWLCRFRIMLSICHGASLHIWGLQDPTSSGPFYLVGSRSGQSCRSTGREVSEHPAVRDVGDCGVGVCLIYHGIGAHLPDQVTPKNLTNKPGLGILVSFTPQPHVFKCCTSAGMACSKS